MVVIQYEIRVGTTVYRINCISVTISYKHLPIYKVCIDITFIKNGPVFSEIRGFKRKNSSAL